MRKLPVGYLKALGQVQATMSLAENGLVFSLQSITGYDRETTVCLVGGGSLKDLAFRISRLVHSRIKRNDDLLKEFDECFEDLRDLYELRNEYTHSLWLRDGKKVLRLKYSREWRNLFKRDPNITPDVLKKFVVDLEIATNKLMKMIGDNSSLLKK